MDYMGKMHPSKPSTEEDKVMSDRHKMRRKMLSKITDRRKRLKASIPYNDKHSKEHKEQNVKNKKELKKLAKAFEKRAKKSG